MLLASDFQVIWRDVVYKIEPKISLSDVWHSFGQTVKTNLLSICKFCCRNRKTGEYTINGPTKSITDREPKLIIDNISGSFKSSELTAVIGPSGAGKTSLLNFLSRRREEGYTGQLFAQNSERRIKISSIPQNDHLPEYLTVRESLMFASRLKNNDPSCDHEENVQKVSSILGLEHCLDTKTKKISGGELKRLAIAQELLSKPDILILDEPTSGLDSLTCYKTISVLKSITQASAKRLINPIAVVITIHQPQQEVFDIFDKIYVLANGGIAIYNGPPDKCTQFVETHAGVSKPAEDYNPASFLIDIAAGEYGPKPIEALERQVKLDFYKSRDKAPSQANGISTKNKGGVGHDVSRLYLEKDSQSVNTIDDTRTWIRARRCSYLYVDQIITKGASLDGLWRKSGILSERYWLSILRDPKQLATRIVLHILLPISLAIILGTEPGSANACPNFTSQYSLRDLTKIDAISNRVIEDIMFGLENIAIMFIILYGSVTTNVALTTLSFTLDMPSTLKEHHNGWYSMPSYIIARLITDLPLTLILPSVSVAIVYPLTGQATGPGLSAGNRILIMAMAVVLASLASQMAGMIIGTLYMGHVIAAMFMSQAALLPFVFLSGLWVRTKNMYPFMKALSNLSIYRHAIELSVIARYGFNACSCIPQSISGQEVKLVGVSDRLRSFTKYWIGTFEEASTTTGDAAAVAADDDNVEPLSDALVSSNSSSLLSSQQTPNSDDDNDIFQLFAKQISRFNTHGIDVRSCNDVMPHQLKELSLNDGDTVRGFVALTLILVSMLLLLLLTMKLVIRFRTSL